MVHLLKAAWHRDAAGGELSEKIRKRGYEKIRIFDRLVSKWPISPLKE